MYKMQWNLLIVHLKCNRIRTFCLLHVAPTDKILLLIISLMIFWEDYCNGFYCIW